MLSLKKWAFLSAAVATGAALFGCAGTHSSSSSGGSGNNNNGSSSGRPIAATITLNAQAASVIVSYLTGVARDDGDLHMVVRNALIHDATFNLDFQNSNNSPLDLNLNQYQIQFMGIDVPTSQQGSTDLANSEQFDFFTLNPYYFAYESGGTIPQNPNDPAALTPDPFIAANPIPVRLRTFPGRDSILPVFLDYTMFQQNGSVVGYNPDGEFQAINQPPTNDPSTSGKIVGFISDFLQFNIGTHYWAGGATNPLPNLINPSGNPTATHFYMSGDAYAFSNDTIYDQFFPAGQTVPPYVSKSPPPSGFFQGDGVLGTSGTFEELTLNPAQPYDGFMDQPFTQPPNGGGSIFGTQGSSPNVNFPGTYDLLQANPTDITGVSKIVSTYGRWRNIETVANLSGGETFDIVIFPNSSDLFTENTPADALGFSHTIAPDGSVVVTNLYAGYAFFTGNPGDKPVARLYPLSQFIQGTTGNEVDYDLSAFTGASGAGVSDNRYVRNGTYTFDTAQSASTTLPKGFLNTGTFVVFRH